MTNKAIEDPNERRSLVRALILQGRYEFTDHARETHTEIPAEDKIEGIFFGANDQPNRGAAARRRSYVCWYAHPDHGLLRGVYAIVEPPPGGQVLIISVFQE